MNLMEQAVDNHMYMIQINEIINDPSLLNEGMLDSIKSWTAQQFNSFATNITQAAKSNDLNKLKKFKSAIPNMSTGEANEIGKKASSEYSSLKATAEKELKKKSKNKLPASKLDAAATAMALASLADKNPKQKLGTALDTIEDVEEGITPKDVVIWIVSAILGVATTIVIAYLTNILFIFGPFIFFAMWAAVLNLIFGSRE